MIVEKSTEGADEAWIVHPCPGYVVKFREVCIGNDLFPDQTKYKLFLNICHCPQLPPPIEDLDEDEVAEILDSKDPSRYRIPLCIGDLDCVHDNKGENSAKVDVLVNSVFYAKRIEKSEFFRHLLLLVCTEAIKAKHGINFDAKDAIKLRNRKLMGELSAQRIRKKPQSAIIQEFSADADSKKENEEAEPVSALCHRPRNYRITLFRGEELEIKVKLPEMEQPICDEKRFRIRMNGDHIIVQLDRRPPLIDIYVPFEMDYEKAKVQCVVNERTLRIIVPVKC